MIKEILIFTGGAIVGGIGGFLGTKFFLEKKLEKKYEDELNDKVNEEIKSVHEAYKAAYKPVEGAEGFNTERDTLNDEKLATEASRGLKDDAMGKNQAVNYRAYSENGVTAPEDMITKPKKTIKEPPQKDEIPEEVEDDDEETWDQWEKRQEENYINGLKMSEERNRKRHDKPKIIKKEQYGEYGTLDQLSLIYYTDDDTLVDADSGEEIIDADLIVGDCLDKYNFRHNTEKTIYVRNMFIGADYEITKQFDAFVPIGNETS